MIRYGIFDVDGTLLDSMGVWHQASARLLEQYHIPMPLDLDEKLAALSLRGGSEYLSHHLLPQLTPEQVREEIDRLLREEYRLRIQWKALQFVDFLWPHTAAHIQLLPLYTNP